MKILITGEPGSGKSTLLEALLRNTKGYGILTRELVDSTGRRQGFLSRASTGQEVTIAAATTAGEPRVGRFQVYPERITQLVLSFDEPRDSTALVYVDEIGQMQLTSGTFQAWVETLFSTQEDIVGTITQVYQSDFVAALKNREDILLVPITTTNRTAILECLISAINGRRVFNQLSSAQQRTALRDARDYIKNARYTSFKKLFARAVPYVQQNKVTRLSEHQFTVNGQHSAHDVRYQDHEWVCDCPLYLGIEPYTHSEECSHIQAVRLFRTDQHI